MNKKIRAALSVVVFLGAGFASVEAKASRLNWVEVFPEKTESISHRSSQLPTQIIFDFSRMVEVSDSVDAQKGRLSLVFKNTSLATFTKAGVAKRLQELESIKKVKVAGRDNEVMLDILFKKETFKSVGSTFSTGVTVRLSRVDKPHHRSHRIVLDLYPKELLRKLSKNQRGLKLARNDFSDEVRVILDAGHGGVSTGAHGFFSLVEKDVTLDLAKRVKPLLEQWGARVVMTRTNDKDVSLASRCSLAHQLKGDVLVSIHANSAGSNQNACGIETYYPDPAITDKSSLMFATNQQALNDFALVDTYVKKNIHDSKKLSSCIQDSVISHLTDAKKKPKSRGVKNEGFCLFLHSQMPSDVYPLRYVPVSLVEVGFISNKDEAQKLATPEYRQLLAKGISQGIKSYIDMRS